MLRPLHDLIATYVLAAERIYGDDTAGPVLAIGKAEQRGPGYMCATMRRSGVPIRRQRCSTTPAAYWAFILRYS